MMDTLFLPADLVNMPLFKVVLSSSPTSSKVNSLFVAMYGGTYNLATCKLGDKKLISISKTGYHNASFITTRKMPLMTII